MNKRICPKCFTRWYSASTADIWKCDYCGTNIPRSAERPLNGIEEGENDASGDCGAVQDLQTKDSVSKEI